MRLPLLALLCVGTVALCQSPAPQKIDPDKLFRLPEKFNPQAQELGKLRPQPFLWKKFILAHPTVLGPWPKPDDRQIDPKIIVRPPWRSQSKGQDVSHRLYPDLKFLPLHHGPPTPR